jgi:hypothetical protein
MIDGAAQSKKTYPYQEGTLTVTGLPSEVTLRVIRVTSALIISVQMSASGDGRAMHLAMPHWCKWI